MQKKLMKDVESELELSKEMNQVQNQYTIAMNHHETFVMTICLRGLIENIFDNREFTAQLKHVINHKKSKRMKQKCFTKWFLIIKKIKK
jgi:hypothetical protein